MIVLRNKEFTTAQSYYENLKNWAESHGYDVNSLTDEQRHQYHVEKGHIQSAGGTKKVGKKALTVQNRKGFIGRTVQQMKKHPGRSLAIGTGIAGIGYLAGKGLVSD